MSENKFTPSDRGRRKPLRQWIQIVGKGLFVIAMTALLVYTAMALPTFARVLTEVVHQGAPLAAVAIISYLGSHMLRALRLAIIVGGYEISLRRLTLVHFATAGVSLLLPLKLGELYRVFELKEVVGSLERSVLTVWMERGFDVGILVFLMAAVVVVPGVNASLFGPLAAASALFIVLTIIAFVVLPENLRAFSLFVIRRYRSEKAVAVLRTIHGVLGFVESGRALLKSKQMLVAAVSAFIWMLEVAAFGLVMAALNSAAPSVLEGFLVYISTASFGAAEWSAPIGGWGNEALPFAIKVLIYGMLTRVPLFVCALALGLLYAPRRLAEQPSIAAVRTGRTLNGTPT